MLETPDGKAKTREAWEQFLEAAPDDKRAPDVQKRLKALAPAAPAARPDSK